MRTVLSDLRHGLRLWKNHPGFAAAAVIALALGIGANTAIFSVVNAVLIRPLPYPDPDRLVLVSERLGKALSGPIGFSPPDFAIFDREQNAFTEIAAFVNRQFELSSAADPERIEGARVSASLFSVLGVAPALGRTFTREDDQPGHAVAVLSDGLWRRKFNADPGIVGKAIQLDRQPYTVVGVMPYGFEFPHRGPVRNNTPAQVWVPIAFTRNELQDWISRYNHSVVARLKPGVNLEQARQDAAALARRIQQDFYPPNFRSSSVFVLSTSVEPFRAEVTGHIRDLLLILQGAVALVLLIACADVANLLLTRAAARQREMAIRTALGAGRLRLVRQLLCESLPLALAGGGLGLALTWWAISLLVGLAPIDIPRATGIRVDAAVLAFTLLICCGATMIFALAPALQGAVSHSLGEALKESGRSATGGRARRRLLGVFVTTQFALSLVLLVGAGLLIRTFSRLLATDPGFRPDNVLSLSVSLPFHAYQDAAGVRAFYRRLLERVEALPGVKTVAAANDLPLAIRERRAFSIENPSPAIADSPKSIANVWVLGNYFEALGARLKQGRFLKPEDGLAGEPTIVINDTLARRYFPGEDPVGRRMKWGGRSPWMRIVGVVEDIKHGPLRAEVIPQAFEPYNQVPDFWVQDTTHAMLRGLSLIVRTTVEPTTLATAVRNEIRALDPSLPVINVQTLAQYVRQTASAERFNAIVLGIFAAVALFLAAVGIYGVLSYSVTQRTHEIGVRMALGARRGEVLWLVVGRGMRLAAIGIAVGLAASVAVTRVLGTLLYGVTARDPGTFAAVVALLGGVALLACYLPARRATRVDPVVALRYE